MRIASSAWNVTQPDSFHSHYTGSNHNLRGPPTTSKAQRIIQNLNKSLSWTSHVKYINENIWTQLNHDRIQVEKLLNAANPSQQSDAVTTSKPPNSKLENVINFLSLTGAHASLSNLICFITHLFCLHQSLDVGKLSTKYSLSRCRSTSAIIKQPKGSI